MCVIFGDRTCTISGLLTHNKNAFRALRHRLKAPFIGLTFVMIPPGVSPFGRVGSAHSLVLASRRAHSLAVASRRAHSLAVASK